MQDIQDYIRFDVIDIIIRVLAHEDKDNPNKDELSTLLNIAFQRAEGNLDEQYKSKIENLKLSSCKSLSIILVESIYHLYNKNYSDFELLMTNLLLAADGKLFLFLSQMYHYARLTEMEKTIEDDVISDLESLLSCFVPNSLDLISLLWDIHDKLPHDFTVEKWLKILDITIKKNQMELALWGFKFYILSRYKKWQMIIDLADIYLYKFSSEISSVCWHKASALFETGQYIRAIKWYQNSMNEAVDGDTSNELSIAYADKGIGLCFLSLGKQRYRGVVSNHEIIDYYRKAHFHFSIAKDTIKDDPELDKLYHKADLVIKSMENCN